MVGETLPEACSIGRAVRQGCLLSPLLVIIYGKVVVREVCHERVIDIGTGGKSVNVIRYVDDKAVVASLQKGVQELMNRRNTVKNEYYMKINAKKMKDMCMSRKGKSKVVLLIDIQQVEQVGHSGT